MRENITITINSERIRNLSVEIRKLFRNYSETFPEVFGNFSGCVRKPVGKYSETFLEDLERFCFHSLIRFRRNSSVFFFGVITHCSGHIWKLQCEGFQQKYHMIRQVMEARPRGILTHMDNIDRCGYIGYGFLAVLVRNRVSILASLVSNRVWFWIWCVFHEEPFFQPIDKTINKSPL